MFYSFARVSAVLKLKVDDYYHNGARRRLRLHEKGGKEHEMPVHHLLEQILDEYIVAAGLQSGQPLFQSVNSLGTAVTGRALNRYNAWAAIRKRAKAAGFLTPVGCHTWRATGITIYLENDGRLEHAQQMAGHESSANNQTLRPDQGRNYAERGGANTTVTFDPSAVSPQRLCGKSTCRSVMTVAQCNRPALCIAQNIREIIAINVI